MFSVPLRRAGRAWAGALVSLLFIHGAVVRALTVVPPTFDELVAEAETIVRGEVTAVRAEEFDSPQGRGVRTHVTLRVERALKGAPGAEITLVQLGGSTGRQTLLIPGLPQFHVGERQIVFVARNERVFCPIVGIGHGRYHVRREAATGREYIVRDNEAPLVALAEIPARLDDGASGAARGPVTANAGAATTATARAMSVADFEARIAAGVAQQPAPGRLPR
jgi:hypothetical protein